LGIEERGHAHLPNPEVTNCEVNTDDVKTLKVGKVGMPPLFGDATDGSWIQGLLKE